MTTWFIADTHFGEQPAKRRKATGMSAEELDALIDARWRECVAEDDTVWHLGDIGKDWVRLARLPGVKRLIFGNNDTARKKLRDSELFNFADESHRFRIPDGSLLLIHDPDHAGDESGPVIHGHLHAAPSPAPNFVSVSVDQHVWRPVALERVLEMLARTEV